MVDDFGTCLPGDSGITVTGYVSHRSFPTSTFLKKVMGKGVRRLHLW